MKTKYLIAVVMLSQIIYSCDKDNSVEIEEELEVHFNQFVEEAENHGLVLDLTTLNISAYVEHIQENGVLGQCKSYSDGSKEVVIDEDYWSRIGEMEREYLVFHELGHCILGREHNDEQDESGRCISIMQSGENKCNNVYENENRDAMISELFEH